MTDDDPITLQDAAEIFFHGQIKKATLLAAIKRGTLKAAKVGRTYFTTTTDLREMMACLAARQAQNSGLARSGNSGSSETERASSARAALQETVAMLKSLSMPISAGSIPRRAAK